MRLVMKVLVNAAAIWLACWIVPGASIGGDGVAHTVLSLIVVGAVFGLVNSFIKPVVKLVALPVYLLSLGLVSFLVNALLLSLVAYLAGGLGIRFDAGSFFWTTVLLAVVISVVSWVLARFVDQED